MHACRLSTAGTYLGAAMAVAAATFVVSLVDVGECPPQSAEQASPAPAAVGINLAELTYYSTEFPFADAFKLSMPFLHQADGEWSIDEPLELRSDGYPARLAPGHFAGTLMFRTRGYYPAGDYTCRYDGSGEIEFDFAARVVSRSPGQMAVRVTPSEDGVYLKITATDPSDPVRNIRFYMPGTNPDAGHPFYQPFLERWRGFAVLRFMDWMRTNGSPIEDWRDRTRIDAQTQATDSGIAPEYIAQLANTMAVDPWICIPHRATDDYVTQLAQLLAQQLAPQRTLYLEYSNETWNGQFAQADYCEARGGKRRLADDGFTAQLRYSALRSTEVFEIFAEVFEPDRLVRVLATQNANPWTSETMLGWRDTYRHVDALAVAPYFGVAPAPDEAGAIAALTVEQLLDRCEVSIAGTLRHAGEHQQLAHRRGIPLLAYEAGQHLVGRAGAENDERLQTLFAAANRAPRMGDLYRDYLAGWRALGGSVLCAFDSTSPYSKWGNWGHAEDYGPGSEEAPKYRALVEFIRTPPTLPAGR